MFIPDIKINETQVQNINTDCPKSGWSTRKIIIIDNNKKDIACEKFKFFMWFELIICETRRIKKGFINSIGWKLKK